MTQKKVGENLKLSNDDTARKKTQKTVKKRVVTYFRVSTDSERQKISSKPVENEAELLGEPVQAEYRKKRNHNKKKEETI